MASLAGGASPVASPANRGYTDAAGEVVTGLCSGEESDSEPEEGETKVKSSDNESYLLGMGMGSELCSSLDVGSFLETSSGLPAVGVSTGGDSSESGAEVV